MSKAEDIKGGAEDKPNKFGVPAGYFQKSGFSIMNKIVWEEELKEFPVIKGLKDRTGFTLPDHYFIKNEVDELTKVFISQSDELENFTELKSIPKEICFKVGKNYFGENGERLNVMLAGNQQARIFDLIFSKASYAIAAMLLIALGFWMYQVYFKPVGKSDCGTLACVDKTDLLKTKNLENMDDEELFELVNTSELEKKLQGKEDKNSSNKTDSSNQISVDEVLDEI